MGISRYVAVSARRLTVRSGDSGHEHRGTLLPATLGADHELPSTLMTINRTATVNHPANELTPTDSHNGCIAIVVTADQILARFSQNHSRRVSGEPITRPRLC